VKFKLIVALPEEKLHATVWYSEIPPITETTAVGVKAVLYWPGIPETLTLKLFIDDPVTSRVNNM